jgi:hypothetical protein
MRSSRADRWSGPVVTPLQTKIVHALRKRVDRHNWVTMFHEEIAGED